MVRSFADRPLPDGVVDRLLAAALLAPTAGNAKGTAWVVLEGPAETTRFWRATTTEDWRRSSRRWRGLSAAPVVAVSLASPAEYVRRYGEPDKAGAGLGPDRGEGAWPVPYWYGDAAFGVMTVLLGATAEGIGACFLGIFRGEEALLADLGAPAGWRVFGAVALGHPDGRDRRSPSLTRPGLAGAARVHRGRWSGGMPAPGDRPPARR